MSAVGAKAAAAAGAASATAAVALDAASAALPQLNALKAYPTTLLIDPVFLECNAVGFAGADAHGLTEFENKDLAVANGAGVRALLDRLDNAFRDV